MTIYPDGLSKKYMLFDTGEVRVVKKYVWGLEKPDVYSSYTDW